MGKWSARLAALDSVESLHTPALTTDKTAKKSVLSVLAVPALCICTDFEAKPRAHAMSEDDSDRAHAVPWNEVEIGRFVGRVMLSMAHGISAPDADDLAERLHLRDVDRPSGYDDRVMCVECAHYRPRRTDDCSNHGAAGARLRGPHIATMLQRCPGFVAAVLPTIE